MNHWTNIELKEVAHVQTGPFGSQLKNEQYIKGGTPVVTVEHIVNHRIKDFDYPSVTNEDKERLAKYLLRQGDIIFTRVGSVDLSAFVSAHQDGWMFSSRMLRVRPNKSLVDSRFLSYYFQQKRFREYILAISVGATMPSINTEILKGLPVSYPPLPEQKAIAEVLSSLDDKIDLLHRQNKTLEAIAETLFRQWFVEEAKEDWEIVKIKDFDVFVTDYVANGSFASLAKNVTYKSTPDHAVLIRLTDYNRGFNGDFVYVDEHAYEFLSKSKLNGDETIISNVGAYAGTVFKCPNLQKPMTLGPNAIVLKTDFNNYFYLLFKSNYGQYLLDGIMSGSAQPKFNKTAFRNIELRYPSIEYIKDFESLVMVYFEKILANTNQIHTLENLRDTLLPKLMSGEVRVKINAVT